MSYERFHYDHGFRRSRSPPPPSTFYGNHDHLLPKYDRYSPPRQQHQQQRRSFTPPWRSLTRSPLLGAYERIPYSNRSSPPPPPPPSSLDLPLPSSSRRVWDRIDHIDRIDRDIPMHRETEHYRTRSRSPMVMRFPSPDPRRSPMTLRFPSPDLRRRSPSPLPLLPTSSSSLSFQSSSFRRRKSPRGPFGSHSSSSPPPNPPLPLPPPPSSTSRKRSNKGIDDYLPGEFGYNFIGEVREIINEETGIMEVRHKSANHHYPPVFFHVSILWIRDPRSGEIVSYNPSIGPLVKVMPPGCTIQLNGRKTDKDCIVEWVAMKIWPEGSKEPIVRGNQDEQMDNLNRFLEGIDKNRSVIATISTLAGGRMQKVHAKVIEIKNEDFGIIQIKGIRRKSPLHCIFHYDSIWTSDDRNAMDRYGDSKTLKDLVHVGQEVNLCARSIIKAKGQDIFPSKLELQAVVVYLKPKALPHTAPRPTRLKGSPGSIGYSRNFTPYFLNVNLLPRLNQQLSNFIRLTGEFDRKLDRKCLSPDFDLDSLKLESTRPSSSSSLKRDLLNLRGVVVASCRTTKSGILRNDDNDHKWLCFFTWDQCRRTSGQTFIDVCGVGSRLRLNASLIDSKRKIQYLASVLWNEDKFPTQRHVSLHRDESLVARYRRAEQLLEDIDVTNGSQDNVGNVNDNDDDDEDVAVVDVDDDYNDNDDDDDDDDDDENGRNSYEENVEGASGKLFKILDDNFALILWENYKVVLFDTCDLWIEDSSTTADKAGKSIKDVLSLNQIVYFHAVLIERDAKIKYLASAVWTESSSNRIPEPVRKNRIHEKKISIFHVVLQSVGGAIVVPKRIKKRSGTIRILFRDLRSRRYVGGMVEFKMNNNNSRIIMQDAFFEIRDHDGNDETERYKLDDRIHFIVKRIKSSTSKFPYIAIGIMKRSLRQSDVNSDDEIQDTIRRWNSISTPEILALISNNNNNNNNNRRRIIDITLETDEADSATLVCMIDSYSGILRNDFNRRNLCYFEREDVNIASNVSLKDITDILANDIPGVRVRYQAQKPILNSSNYSNSEFPVQYIANVKGVQIQVPTPDVRILGSTTKSVKSNANDVSRIQRWKSANRTYSAKKRREQQQEEGDKRYDDTILTVRHKQFPEKQFPEEILIRTRGRVRLILNENFGLAQDIRTGSYCLFDTYDLYVTPETTASELQKSVGDVFNVGMEVTFNATLIDETRTVPYLITGIWEYERTDTTLFQEEPVPISQIQKEKIRVYETVSNSCEPLLRSASSSSSSSSSSSRPFFSANRRESPPNKKSRSDEKFVAERKYFIDKTYETDEYKRYLSKCPKHERRTNRDPITPDPEYSRHSSDLSEWKTAIERWTTTTNDSNQDFLDDSRITGTLYSTERGNYATLRLSNGCKALLHKKRIWLSGSRLSDPSKIQLLIHKEKFRILHVCARKLTDIESDLINLEYQALYVHAASPATRSLQDGKFEYPNTMKKWVQEMKTESVLDSELNEYIRQVTESTRN